MKTQLTIKKETANKIKEGMIVALNRCADKSGRVITKTDKIITVLADSGCYDFIVK